VNDVKKMLGNESDFHMKVMNNLVIIKPWSWDSKIVDHMGRSEAFFYALGQYV
jgi:hypothetical protein